jgi:MFS family permease
VTSYISVGITAGGHQGKLGQALRRLGKAMVPEPNAMNRVALLGQTKPTPELVQRAWWSAMIGALLGALWPTAMLLVAAVSTTAGKDLPDDLMILVLPAVSLTAPSAFFVAATEPGRMRLVSDSSDRFIASFVAVFTLSISAIVVTSLFLIPLVLTGIVSEGGLAGQWPWVRNLFLIEGAAIAIGGIFGWLVGGTGNTTAKEYPPPARFYVAIAPYFVAAFVIAIPSGAGMFYLLGWEPWHAGFSFAAIGGIAQHLLLSGILSEYRNPLTRLVPFGLISIADPIVAVRMFWRDYYIDGSGNPLRVFFSVTGIMSASMLGSVLFAIGVSLLIMSVGYDQDSALSAVFIGVIFSLPAILILPTLMNPRRNQALDADNLETIAQLCRVGEVDSRFEHHIEDLLDNIGQVFTSDQARIAVLGRPENREQLRVIASSSRLLRAAKRDGILDSWKQPIEQYLDGLNREDGAIAAWPDGPANLRWTAYGTKIICEGLLYSQSHRENSLDKLENLLAHWLAKPNPKHRSGRVWRRQDLVLAAFVLDDEGRPNLAKAAAKVILEELRYDGYPASGLSFFQIVRCLRISNTARPEQEANITRAIHERAWSLMHSNPRKEAAALLDCIEAATLLGSSPENRPHALNDLLIDLLDRFSREDAHRLRLSTL